jgi:hypothetical protein
VSLESSSIDILDQLCWRPWKKEKDFLRDYMEEKGGGPFSWVVEARWKRSGYLDCYGCWETYESLRDDWFGNPSTLWNRPCGFIALARG